MRGYPGLEVDRVERGHPRDTFQSPTITDTLLRLNLWIQHSLTLGGHGPEV